MPPASRPIASSAPARPSRTRQVITAAPPASAAAAGGASPLMNRSWVASTSPTSLDSRSADLKAAAARRARRIPACARSPPWPWRAPGTRRRARRGVPRTGMCRARWTGRVPRRPRQTTPRCPGAATPSPADTQRPPAARRRSSSPALRLLPQAAAGPHRAAQPEQANQRDGVRGDGPRPRGPSRPDLTVRNRIGHAALLHAQDPDRRPPTECRIDCGFCR